MPMSDSLEALAIRQEAKRFETFYPNIQALYHLLEQVDHVPLKRKMRELVNKIEGAFPVSRSQLRGLSSFSCDTWSGCLIWEYVVNTVAVLDARFTTRLWSFSFLIPRAYIIIFVVRRSWLHSIHTTRYKQSQSKPRITGILRIFPRIYLYLFLNRIYDCLSLLGKFLETIDDEDIYVLV